MAQRNKFKIDENLSPGIKTHNSTRDMDIEHVNDENLTGHPDIDVWNMCVAEDRTLITMNGRDFAAIADNHVGQHPGIIWVHSLTGRLPTREIQITSVANYLAFYRNYNFRNQVLHIAIFI